MNSEASTSSSPSATDLSKINATTAHKKRKAKSHRGGARRRRRPEPNPDVAAVAVHGAAAHAEIGRGSLHVDTDKNGSSLVGGSEEVEFVDEEAMFNMPLLLDCMAQGMLLTPPAIKKGFTWDEDDHHMDLTLWRD